MKKTIILLAISLMISVWVTAAPALRGLFTVTQPDGTELTIEQFGDEFHHWTSTTDGTIVVNTGHGYYVAQIDEEGELTASDILAHEAAQREREELLTIEKQDRRKALFHQQGELKTSSQRALSISNKRFYLPHTGNIRVLTILAAFQDLDFTVSNPVKAFDQYMNGNTQEALGNKNELNLSSVQKYLSTCSHGQFVPQFDIVGPITLPQKMEYYGGSSESGSDDKFFTFCQDAVNKANEANLVKDWTIYDNDKDGRVELVCIIFAGYGQNQGGANNTLWAKSTYLPRTIGNVTINSFNCSSEKFHPDSRYKDYINGIGVFTHELSHCMGLPDLYATQSTGFVNNQNMESYSIMDYGCYNYNGFAPCPYTAWEQEVMGWTEIEPITDGSQITNLLPVEEGGKAYKIVNPDNDRDCIVLENIQYRGLNKYAEGHGLLVYHVDYPYSSVNMDDNLNNNPGHPSVAVVPAGGTLISSYLRGNGKTYTTNEWRASMEAALFPGTKLVTALSDDMKLPNYCLWQGNTAKETGFKLNSISEDDKTGAISFTVAPKEASGISATLKNNQGATGVVYDLQGRKVVNPTKGLYIVNGRKYIQR